MHWQHFKSNCVASLPSNHSYSLTSRLPKRRKTKPGCGSRWLQWCWAHLKRDIQKLIDSSDNQVKRLGHDLMRQQKLLFQHWRSFKENAISWEQFQMEVAPIREEFDSLRYCLRHLKPPPRKPKIARLHRSVDGYVDTHLSMVMAYRTAQDFFKLNWLIVPRPGYFHSVPNIGKTCSLCKLYW